nr:Crp/Fnr family transcriptional regulator [Chryseosolibacter indicus]
MFREIPESDFEVISKHCHIATFPTGTVLLEEGKVAKQLFFVLDGILKIKATTDKGIDVIHFFVKENKFCTILYSFLGGDMSRESIITAVDTELVVFSKQELELVFKQLPYFEGLIQTITHQTLLEKIKVRNSYMGEDATARYLKFITQQPEIMLRLPLSDVASYLGITQQSLSRIRRDISHL